MRSFLLIQLLKRLLYSFHLTCNLSPFSFKYFFYSKFFLTSFFHVFFIKTSSNFFTIQITNNISPRNCIFNFTNNKNFFCISFSKNVFIFWNSNFVTNFKFRIFFIKISILFSIRIICNVNRCNFNNFMNCYCTY